MSKPIFVILGATGIQGGSVLKHAYQTGKFHIRACTRDPSSKKVVALRAKYPGVEWVSFYDNMEASITAAFTGADVVFTMTQFWQPISFKEVHWEEETGIRLADIANKTGIKFYIYSSLPSISKLSGGKLTHATHFDGKNNVEQYIRTQLPQLKAAFVYPGFYMENFASGFIKLEKEHDGTIVWTSTLAPDVIVTATDMEHDFGAYVMEAALNQNKFHNKVIDAVSEITSPDKMMQQLGQVTGQKARYVRRPRSKEDSDEMWDMHEFYNMKVLHPQIILKDHGTWIEYLKRTGYKG